MGVDVFYVLSGYLITGLLVTQIEATGRLDLVHFYARRIRRLLPASSLVLLVTLLVGAFIFAPKELMSAALAARASALYVSNLFFARGASDYFSAKVEFNPFLHTWSLAVEEQFYLVWPCLIAVGLLVFHSKRALAGLLAILTVVSFAISVGLTEHHRAFAFYELPTRAWEFGAGGLAALLPRGSLKLPAAVWIAAGCAGVAVVVGSGLFVSSAMSFPGWIALLPVVGTAVTLTAGAEHPHRGIGRVFDAAPLQTLGRLSYSWYLWHWPILVVIAALIPGASALVRALAAAAALGIAAITHRWIENPIRYSPRLSQQPSMCFAVGAGLAAVCLAAAILSSHWAFHLSKTVPFRLLATTRADFASLSRRDCISLDGSSDTKMCTFGSLDSRLHIVLFGDSHAAQWFDSLLQASEQKHWKLTTVLKIGCAAVEVEPGRGIDRSAECKRWREQAISRIIALTPSLIILGSATNDLGRPEKPEVRAGGALIADVREGVLRTIRPFTAANLKLALLRDTPEFPFDVTSCLGRLLRHHWLGAQSCDMPRDRVLDPGIYAAEHAAAAGRANVGFIDLSDSLCPRGVCRATLDGSVMYRDSHHLAGTAAATLTPEVERQILAALQ